VDRAGVGVLEQPTPVGSALGADVFDRFGQPGIGSAPTLSEVLRGLEEVVVPAWWVGEQRPLRVDDLARAQGPEEVALQEVLLAAGSRLDQTVADGFFNEYGIKILSCYHSTEAATVALEDTGKFPTTVGKPIDGVEVKITGPDGKAVACEPDPSPLRVPGPSRETPACRSRPFATKGHASHARTVRAPERRPDPSAHASSLA